MPPEEVQKLINDWKYMVGFAERGRGEPLPPDVTGVKYLLDYIQELEAQRELLIKRCSLIHLGSMNSMTSKEALGKEAHEAAVFCLLRLRRHQDARLPGS